MTHTLRIAHTGTHNASATPDANGNYVVAMVRKSLSETEIVPGNLRFNTGTGTVQQTYDGGATWVDQPGADPRSADVFRFPSRGGSDPRCDAAANMVANIEAQIFNSTNVISSAGNAIAGVTLILQSLELLGGWGLVASLIVDFCNLLVSIGVTAVHTAFTSTVYDDLNCIFYCDIASDGTVSELQLSNIQSDISAHYGALSDVNIVLQGVLGYMGAVGLSNAGATGTATGSCGGCSACGWEKRWDASSGWLHWASAFSSTGSLSGGVWPEAFLTPIAGYRAAAAISFTLPSGAEVTYVEIGISNTSGQNTGWETVVGARPFSTNNELTGSARATTPVGSPFSGTFAVTAAGVCQIFFVRDRQSPGGETVAYVIARGTGTMPSW